MSYALGACPGGTPTVGVAESVYTGEAYPFVRLTVADRTALSPSARAFLWNGLATTELCVRESGSGQLPLMLVAWRLR